MKAEPSFGWLKLFAQLDAVQKNVSAALTIIALENLQGWVSREWDAQAAEVAGKAALQAARALGAKA